MTKQLTPLEALKLLKSNLTNCECIRFGKYITIIEPALKRLEEQDKCEMSALISSHKKLLKEKKENEKKLKAFEIIKIKAPNVFWIMRTKTYKEYTRKIKDDTLLQEEFNLLKKVLL